MADVDNDKIRQSIETFAGSVGPDSMMPGDSLLAYLTEQLEGVDAATILRALVNMEADILKPVSSAEGEIIGYRLVQMTAVEVEGTKQPVPA